MPEDEDGGAMPGIASRGGGVSAVAAGAEAAGGPPSPSIEDHLAQVAGKMQYSGCGTNPRSGRSPFETPARRPAAPPGRAGGHAARVLNMSEGGTEAMRPVRRSPQHSDQDLPSLPSVAAEAIEGEMVPTECPAVFVEQPLERWSPRDLVAGVFRLVRWTRLATS